MSFTTGTRIGPYEITSPLGEGGMGVVYRARDTKLGRDVAIKALPDAFANDSDRLQRFQREAQVLASLNHPNIAHIYGLEESDKTRCIVMELVEGETLQERIKLGPIPVEEALPIAKQIAEALEAAHEKGIIHRDLKPANIKFTATGQVKVLDFGLAKATEAHPMNPTFSNSPTLASMAATNAGVLLGTAAYMSPEQARGEDTDERSDIFSFGCVLYEILAGQQAFPGKTVSDILASVLKVEPDWNRLPEETPAFLRRLLRRSLQKDAKRRLQTAIDVLIEIEEAKFEPEANASAIPPVSPSIQRKLRAWEITAIVFFLAMVTLIVASIFQPAKELETVRFYVNPPDKTALDTGLIASTAAGTGSVSPDGHKLVFAARDAVGRISLWIRSLDSLSAQALPGTDGAALPFWSPDSRWVGFFAQGKLKKIAVAGGSPQTLADAPGGRGGTWNRDGVIVFSPSFSGPLSRISAAGGQAAPAGPIRLSQPNQFPYFLPDGKHFLYSVPGTAENSGVFVGTLNAKESERLLSSDSPAIYAPPGYLLFVREGTLFAQTFNAERLQLQGEPVTIAEQVAYDRDIRGFAASENGVLTYRTELLGGQVQLAWFDRTGKLLEKVGPPGSYRGVELSPDGKRLAVHRHDGNGGDVWINELGRDIMPRLTFDASQDNSMPVWSPDGTRIVFGSHRNGKWGLYQKAATGTGGEELLVESDLPKMPMSWSLDGKFIVYWVADPKTGSDQWILPLTGEKKPVPFLQSVFGEGFPQISPDGKWIAYLSNETGRGEIYVRSFPSGEGKWQISTNGANFTPRWRRDGRELFYMSGPTLKIMSVKINPAGPTFEYSAPIELFDSGYVNFTHGLNYHTYAVSADGQRFLIPRPESAMTDAAHSPITVVLNWPAALKKN
jgi:serine/threonine protein kinase/Tol biopolymer transport system component